VLTDRASTLPLQLQDSALQTQHTALHRAFALHTVRGMAPTATSANTADTRCSPHCCCSVLLIALVMAQVNGANLHTQHATGQSQQQSTSCRCPVIPHWPLTGSPLLLQFIAARRPCLSSNQWYRHVHTTHNRTVILEINHPHTVNHPTCSL
jgi:hypothetical protein